MSVAVYTEDISSDDSLRLRGVRQLWWIELLGSTSDWLATLALVSAVAALGGGAVAFTALLVARTTPAAMAAAVMPRAGLGDRVALLLAHGGRAAVVGLMALAWSLGSLPGLLVAVGLWSALGGAAKPAQAAAVAEAAGPSRMSAAVSSLADQWAALALGGALLGGLVVTQLGVMAALALGSALSVLAALAAGGLSLHGNPDAVVVREVADPRAPAAAGLKAALALGGLTVAVWPLLLVDVGLPATPLLLGALYAARGGGAIVGSRLSARVSATEPLVERVSFGLMLQAVALVAFALATTYAVMLAAAAALGLGASLVWVGGGVLLPRWSEGASRRRLMGLETAGAAVVALALGGPASLVIDSLGYSSRLVVWVAAFAAALVWGAWTLGIGPGTSSRRVPVLRVARD